MKKIYIFVLVLIFLFYCNFSFTQTLLDNYDGTGNLTYITEGSGTDYWNITGGQYEGKTGGLTLPNHSYASYDLSGSISKWELNNSNSNCWFGWMDLNRTSVSGWGASSYSCGMVLGANSSDFNESSTNGYAIGFQNTGDYLVLFRFTEGIVSGTVELPLNSTVIVNFGYAYANGDNGVNFYVELLSDGKWKVYYKSGAKLSDEDATDKENYSDGDATSSSADNTYRGIDYKYAGWIYAHYTGSSEKAYFDNFGVGGLSQEPTSQTSGLSIDNTTYAPDMLLTFAEGNGDGRIIIARDGSPVNSDPEDGTTYTGNLTFGSGDEIGSGNFVVYSGSGSDADVQVTGLTAGNTYYFAFYEYNGSGTSINYLQISPLTGNSSALPVELTSFTSSTTDNSVQLTWSTAVELNNSGFDVERKKTESNNWQKIGFVEGHGTTNTPQSYSFSDRFLSTGKFNYRLKQIDYNGNYQYYYLGSEVSIGVPKKFELSQNFPNPFNPVTKISYELPNDSKVSIKIFDILGREVGSLVDEFKTAGYHTVDFDGSTLSSGMYFYRIKTDEFEAIKKMLLVK